VPNWWAQHKGPVIAGGVIGTALLGGTAAIIGGVHASKKNEAAAHNAAYTATAAPTPAPTPATPVFGGVPTISAKENTYETEFAAKIQEDEKEGSSASSWSSPSSESSSGARSSGSSAPIWFLATLLLCLSCVICGVGIYLGYRFCYKKKTRSTRDKQLKEQMQAAPPSTYVSTPPPQAEVAAALETAPLIETPVPVVETAAPPVQVVVDAPAPMYTVGAPVVTTTSMPAVETVTAPPVYMTGPGVAPSMASMPPIMEAVTAPPVYMTGPGVASTTVETPSWYTPGAGIATAPMMTTFTGAGAVAGMPTSYSTSVPMPGTFSAQGTPVISYTGALGAGAPITTYATGAEPLTTYSAAPTVL